MAMITNISVALFCFLLFVGGISTWADSISLFGGASGITIDAGAIDSFNGTAMVEELNPANTTGTYEWWSIFGIVTNVYQGLNVLLAVLGVAVNLGGTLKGAIPFLPDAFCGAITAIVGVVYVLGVLQWILGRSEKGMR